MPQLYFCHALHQRGLNLEAGQAASCRRFSSRDVEEKNRIAVWREVYGQTVVRLDIEPLRDHPFEADIRLRALPGVKLIAGAICGARDRRTSALMADGNDDFGFALNISGTSVVTQCGHESTLGAGDGILMSCGDPGTFMRPSPSRFLGIRIPRATLMAHIPDAEDKVGQKAARGTMIGLLLGYIETLMQNEALGGAEQKLAANHIVELAALAFGAQGSGAQAGGVRAARLTAIKADIAARFSSPTLSLETVAARHGVSARYVQILFDAEKETFSEFLLHQRLAHARRVLSDPHFSGRPIAAIAFDAGFADLSTFNRAFRRRFGMTPSEMRRST
jgi:AraC-like DNA-binding protein